MLLLRAAPGLQSLRGPEIPDLLGADANKTSLQTRPATVRVYEKLRRQLGAPIGVGGFQSLASRALALAKSDSPRLISTVEVTANGGCAVSVKPKLIWTLMRAARQELFLSRSCSGYFSPSLERRQRSV